MAIVEVAASDGFGEITLLKEANHRIANNLTLLLSTIHIHASSVAKGPEVMARDAVGHLLRDIGGKITSIGHLHRHLALQPGVPDLDAGNFLIESCAALVSSLSLAERVGVVQRLSTECRIKPDQAQPLGLILSEVVMNAVKYAHPSGIPVQIRIDCSRGADGTVAIEIGDDGVGLPEGFDPSRNGGVGFRLIRSLTAQLGAKLEIESDSLGLVFRLRLPPNVSALKLPENTLAN